MDFEKQKYQDQLADRQRQMDLEQRRYEDEVCERQEIKNEHIAEIVEKKNERHERMQAVRERLQEGKSPAEIQMLIQSIYGV